MPTGGVLVDARLPAGDVVEGAVVLPAEILFFHLSELKGPLCVVAEEPERARQVVRRLRQCGREAWVWKGPVVLRARPHRRRREDGWWVYDDSGDRQKAMKEEEGGIWDETVLDFGEAGLGA